MRNLAESKCACEQPAMQPRARMLGEGQSARAGNNNSACYRADSQRLGCFLPVIGRFDFLEFSSVLVNCFNFLGQN